MKTKFKIMRRMIALMLSVFTMAAIMILPTTTVYAADGTLYFDQGPRLDYGTLFTTRMSFDGSNTAYCTEPMKWAPESGNYEYTLLANDSPLRKALYYLQGNYGFEKVIKNQYFSGWSDDEIYIIGHLVVSYIYDGYDDSGDAFAGAPTDYINKAVEVANAIISLPNPPESMRAFIIPSSSLQTVVGSWYKKPCGWIELKKATANPGISDANGCYSLEGAKYGIYQGETQIETLTTDQNGYAKSGELEEGSYTIRELEASNGYALDVNSYQVEVKTDVTTSVNVEEVPQNNPISIVLQKVDAELQVAQAQGSASLEGAEFTVKYYTTQMDTDPAGNGIEAERTWTFKTDAEGKVNFSKEYLVSGDEFYYQMDGTTPCLPLGTVTIQETKAPEGYLLNSEIFVQKIVTSGTEETVTCFQSPEVPDQIIRADLEFVKVSDGDLNRLANVPFSITSKSTEESHIIVTDKNGYASTASDWNKHTNNTNAGTSSEDGVWFGKGEPDDNKGALYYDTYIIEEQRCDANEGMNLLKFEVAVYKDSVTVDLGTLTDDYVVISTTVRDKDTDSHFSKPDGKVTLIDTVEYEGLKRGQEYKIVGTLMEQETGEPLLVDGKKVTAETTFKAKKTTGSVEVKFEFDGTGLEGKTVVVFEELFQEDVKLAVHADITDKDQTIYFPLVGTTAKDGEDGDKEISADIQATIIDTVEYKNLLPGETYRVTGVLMNQETGKELLVNGKAVTAEGKFIAEKSEGTVDVTFTFDASSLESQNIVVFEKLYFVYGKSEVEIAAHENIEDEGQTVKLVKKTEPPKPETPKNTPKTGDTNKTLTWIGLAIAAIMVIRFLIFRMIKKYKEKRELPVGENK